MPVDDVLVEALAVLPFVFALLPVEALVLVDAAFLKAASCAGEAPIIRRLCVVLLLKPMLNPSALAPDAGAFQFEKAANVPGP